MKRISKMQSINSSTAKLATELAAEQAAEHIAEQIAQQTASKRAEVHAQQLENSIVSICAKLVVFRDSLSNEQAKRWRSRVTSLQAQVVCKIHEYLLTILLFVTSELVVSQAHHAIDLILQIRRTESYQFFTEKQSSTDNKFVSWICEPEEVEFDRLYKQILQIFLQIFRRDEPEELDEEPEEKPSVIILELADNHVS